MKFNGKTYPYNPSLEPVASKSQQLGSQLILKKLVCLFNNIINTLGLALVAECVYLILLVSI